MHDFGKARPRHALTHSNEIKKRLFFAVLFRGTNGRRDIDHPRRVRACNIAAALPGLLAASKIVSSPVPICASHKSICAKLRRHFRRRDSARADRVQEKTRVVADAGCCFPECGRGPRRIHHPRNDSGRRCGRSGMTTRSRLAAGRGLSGRRLPAVRRSRLGRAGR